MIKNLYSFHLLFILLLVSNCKSKINNKQDDQIFTISYSNTKEKLFEEYFDISNPKIVQFEYSDTITLSDKLLIQPTNSYYFVYDALTIQMYRFNKDGSLINKIGTTGSAPDEYSNILSFQVDTITKTLDVLCNGGNKIMTFDYHGRYVKSFLTPVNTASFAKINNNSYWFYSGFTHPKSFRIHLCDTNSIIKSYLPLKTKAIEFTEQNFSGINGNGLFRESLLPSIYMYDSVNFAEVLRFDFGKKTITEEALSKVVDPFKYYDNILKNGVYTTIQTAQNKKTIYVRTLYQKEERAIISHFIFNKTDSSTIKLTNDELFKEFSLKLSIVDIDNENFYNFLTSPGALEDFLEKNSINLNNVNRINPNGNPIIISFKPLN